MSSPTKMLWAAMVWFCFTALASAAEGEAKPEAAPAGGAVAANASAASPAATPSQPADATKPADAGKPAEASKPADASKPAAGPLPGHSMHGEAFDEGPRQRAYLMPGTGVVDFPITTRSAEAQQFFNQGVGQLHGFWYFEAERSFRQAAVHDPDCAMLYWGMAMANVNNEKRAKNLIDKAVQKKASASRREIAWIDALAASYAGADSTERRRKYVRDLEAIVQEYPNDLEAKAFLALQIWKNGSWMTEKKLQLPISSHQAVDTILDQIFAVQPMHPAHHFRIHLWDEEKPARALVSASLCGQSAPGIAHMWHMPGHTYSKLNRYADAAWQQEASARVDHAHMMRDGVLPDQIHNYAHNNEWLIRDLGFLGRVNDAIALAKNMVELPRHPKYNTLDRGNTSAGLGRNRLADVLGQYECWQEILDLRDTQYLEPRKDNDQERLKRARLVTLALIGQGKLDDARREITGLEEVLKEKRAARYKAADEAEAKARGENKSAADVSKAMADALAGRTGAIEKLETGIEELKAYAALAAGDQATARNLFEKVEKAKDSPARKDHLARAFALAGDHARAESLARKAVEQGPEEVYPLAVLVEVLSRAGKKPECQAEFTKLRSLAAQADLERPVFARLVPIAQEFGWPADWRVKRGPASDCGNRPELASLGPLVWQPTPATSWSLDGADGGRVALEQYRGKPVLVVFYLGSGCLHCVEQLQKLAPMAGEFTSAGISIAAISSEPLDTLKGSLAKLAPEKTIPFPLAADPQAQAFKAYRAFDDFENAPLHGTFLIDGAGLVRWQDISYEPFVDFKFLLEESQRLLGQR